ncbi:prolyl-tRNA synthetase associated domain-containing protein [Pseudoalteromonas byunsanensis]|uniref:Ala-tRNA(Pro) hydrolase n=1 Tax=Pseudoalteromonas byunsanensis TaxID=327939 RepID=A0A1S1NC49_9GAMM|nr:prolyl-tRNA synthetase associated domain-containing protein [Pseudoalteromonas byunsanensis]OHU97722.1 Ala-tRNA(Pro) hydrolase [Pseudoalteromonas byunsanensis]
MSLEHSLAKALKELKIEPIQYEHPALHTCDEADKLQLERQGTRIKNLFLRDNYGRRHVLLLLRSYLKVDLKTLSIQQGLSRLGFASDQRLEKYLKIQPGCVSALALFNDSDKQVELWIDSGLWDAKLWQCHPLDNRKTWVLSKPQLLQFWQYTGHKPQVIDVPCL